MERQQSTILLPPAGVLERWRKEGLTPEQIYQKCEEMTKARKQAGEAGLTEIERIRQLREQGIGWKEIERRLRLSPDPQNAWATEDQTRLEKTPLKPTPPPCDCGEPHYAKGKCRRCYQRQYKRPAPQKPPRRPVNKKLPDLEKLVELYQEMSMRQIAKIYGVTVQAVQFTLARTDAVAKKREARKAEAAKEPREPAKRGAPRKLPENEQLLKLYQTKTAQEIADFYGVGRQAIYNRLRKTGIPRRRPGPRSGKGSIKNGKTKRTPYGAEGARGESESG